MSKFSDRLFTLRKEHNLTLQEVSDILEERYGYTTNKGMISKYEKGIQEANVAFLNYTAEIFGVTLEYLMGRSDDKYGENVKYKEIPILGTIAAGTPILAQEDILGHEYINPYSNIDFCLKVKGDSMINARIFDGDIVFIHAQCEVETGEIAAVQINDEEATLKRVYIINGNIILHPENLMYEDIVINKKDRKEVTILGKAVMFKSEVR
ncbi:MAG TPA: S24 family peptidase [Clostridiaceae bacterium]